jgi:hypothetical protein
MSKSAARVSSETRNVGAHRGLSVHRLPASVGWTTLCATPRELVTERVDLGFSCGYEPPLRTLGHGTRLSAIFNATFFDAVAIHIDDFEDAIGEFVFIGVENSIQGRKRGRIILFGFRSD